ncbi:hypothetical protein CcaverHIS002_0703800 [Cutaneotrichosporon cavernicola]|uniref:Protein kinase domain-containing protein n=1 Tax=Cutaneotrichosporon cavernicola TaxID=279322 RepID=A0AA48LAA4_9TREE|nr:uncharacterized protein CcaverHIS019_0703880 [Cutaneotrichosporon cavernicola]BEI87034.1 hypothetical protein CcaverHIS002_0703800 [Cutaneotrichosporon cavernicola]BEI94807.1 hypothetical protein CcaverHIS019_0703880 [Cutaneotrichosporon cavernicola]BEJ02582.1 hypothetical protein CcaverHIS631_0703770 [Cutaneotrichosporon cavernicola]BEJ10338.1 hypothetical protein CcaverHIS641_0703730 [Cutaneotrichosporon cavernicola]
MLSVASSLFGKSSTLGAYTLHSAGPSPSSSSTNLPASGRSSPSPRTKSFNVGLWKVVGASHKTTGKAVSVWVFEKRVLDGVRSGRDWVLEQLKKEATGLSRLRHPDVLHMVEPLEETRAELTFVTEVVSGSLGNVLATAKKNGEVDLDEVEIQKGTLQVARALGFLHTQARSVHLNLSPDAILVNAKGDWKLSGLSLVLPLQQPDGSATKHVYPDVDTRLPPQVQWKLDYLAPEYALDNTLAPANDLYSLGCVLYALHIGRPPFATRGSMQALRENADGLDRRDYARGVKWDRASNELKDLLPRLLTRQPAGRITLQSLPSHPFFSSLAISTLNFLDPTTFASKPREEKATFLRGLVRVLPNFSERLKKGKILLSLLEEMKDPYLLPFLLPNVFEISKNLDKTDFAVVLPKLQPLFALKDPPQNMLTLLDNLTMFEEKTSPAQFRENVMPIIYNSLESEHLPVQERVLKLVPHLCEILDYGTVQNVLLTKIAILFTRTRILSVKVQTLDCFAAMVSTLDTTTLTTKLVPLLAKIKTKEPAVMVATLSVHEAMGQKVSLEAIATLVLPQLWVMSMGPLLNADQFARFMRVIQSLGARVEKEHSQHLREVRKMEEQTTSFATNGAPGDFTAPSGEVDFETLVKGGATTSAPATIDPWSMDGWDDDNLSSFASISVADAPSSRAPPSRLGATRVPSSSFNASAFPPTTPAFSPHLASPPMQPMRTTPASPPMQPLRSPASPPRPSRSSSGPNYNLSLDPQAPKATPRVAPPPMQSPTFQPLQPQGLNSWNPASTGVGMGGMGGMGGMSMGMGMSSPPVVSPPIQSQPRPPPGWSSGVMQPSVAKPAWNAAQAAKTDWGDFDPLK